MSENAMTLKQVAEKLGLSYSTIFQKRHEIGFRLPGGRVWLVWPSRLAELSAPRNTVTRLSLRVVGENPCQSVKMKNQVFGKSTSARQAAKELDALLSPRTERRRKSTTTS